jgi:hypothetical protein
MLPIMKLNTLAGLLVLLGALLLVGCDRHAADKAQIRQTHASVNACNDNSDGAGMLPLMTEKSFAYYDRLRQIALDGAADKVRGLDPADRLEVLTVRARAKRADIAKLDGRGYVKFCTAQGFYATAPEDRGTSTLRSFKFGNDTATAEMVEDEEPTGIRLRFVREEGAWKVDEEHNMTELSRFLERSAAKAGVSTDRICEMILEEKLDGEVPQSVWQPMK